MTPMTVSGKLPRRIARAFALNIAPAAPPLVQERDSMLPLHD
jgi:hypothetical protein